MIITLILLSGGGISPPGTKWKGGCDASLGCEADGEVMHKPA